VTYQILDKIGLDFGLTRVGKNSYLRYANKGIPTTRQQIPTHHGSFVSIRQIYQVVRSDFGDDLVGFVLAGCYWLKPQEEVEGVYGD
jgi:hypothetical protein